MVDIFSSFDDHNMVFMSFVMILWLGTLWILMLFMMKYWVGHSRWTILMNSPKQIIFSQVFRSFGKNLGGFVNVIVGLFMFLLVTNLLGLFPYVFSSTSHLAVTFSLAFPFWFSLLLSGFVNNMYAFAAGLLPSGAPVVLNPFLVLVESLSICMRPITLSIRLTANMGAGHVILGLLGTYLSSGIFSYPLLVTLLLVFVQVVYFVFEFGVSLIQGYVFSLLLTLYADEHTH
uniref:ATP synthase subunit a n=1 Tax=Solemya velesiana TaxID=395966 RepID=A0A1W5WVE5_9BIVA|nr:ATP synthase F0 subunit 6 [Solemya velesiana]ARH10777.1 ATP synthase F0 subunit 6 [Solemya velesiana]